MLKAVVTVMDNRVQVGKEHQVQAGRDQQTQMGKDHRTLVMVEWADLRDVRAAREDEAKVKYEAEL